MHLQNLKLLHPTGYEKMYLQANTCDLDHRVKVTRNVAQYPLHDVTYAPAKFAVATVYEEMHLQENTFLTLTLGSRS